MHIMDDRKCALICIKLNITLKQRKDTTCKEALGFTLGTVSYFYLHILVKI